MGHERDPDVRAIVMEDINKQIMQGLHMRNCGICGINLVDGHKICLECFGKMVEEEAIASWKMRVAPVSSTTYYRNNSGCNHCWPFDCRCY